MKVTVTEIHEMESTGAGFDMVKVEREDGVIAILERKNTYDKDLNGCNEYHEEKTVEYATFEEFWNAGWNNGYEALHLATEEFQQAKRAELKAEKDAALAAGKTHFFSNVFCGAHYSRAPRGKKWRLTEIVF